MLFQIDDITINYTELAKEVGIGNAYAISELEPWKRKALLSRVDIYTDYIIAVDSEGFTVNHGNVGSYGIRYSFDRMNTSKR